MFGNGDRKRLSAFSKIAFANNRVGKVRLGKFLHSTVGIYMQSFL